MGSIGICGRRCRTCLGNCWPVGFPDDATGVWYCGLCRLRSERADSKFFICSQVPQLNILANQYPDIFCIIQDFFEEFRYPDERSLRRDVRRIILMFMLHPLRDRHGLRPHYSENRGILKYGCGDLLDYIIDFVV